MIKKPITSGNTDLSDVPKAKIELPHLPHLPRTDVRPSEADAPFYRLFSATLNEEVVVVSDRNHLTKARAAHPHLGLYFEKEIDELMTIVDGRNGEQETTLLRMVNLAKKEFKAWVVPGMGSSGVGRREAVVDGTGQPNGGGSDKGEARRDAGEE